MPKRPFDMRCGCKKCECKLSAQCDMNHCDCCFSRCREDSVRAIFGRKKF